MTAAAAPTVRALTCPACGGTIALRAAGISVSLICEHCGTTLDTADEDLKIIAQAASAMATPEIPLGTRGEIGETVWEVVGYLERGDGESEWSEYLLFNPYRGYAFLLDDGHRFSLGRLLDRLPEWENDTNRATYGSEAFSSFGTGYRTWVRFVVGEFYWRVAVGERVTVTDYVCPGKMLSCEENGDERIWTLLTLLDRGVAESAFGIPKRFVRIGTPAPHEPSPYRARMVEAVIIGIVAAFTLIVIALMGNGTQDLARASFDTVIDAPMTTQVIRGIPLTKQSGTAVTVSAYAPGIENGWIEIDASLVNTATDQSYDGYVLAERYNGVDSDGRWTEGNRRGRATFSSLPAGQYDLVVELTAHRWIGARQSPSDRNDTPNAVVPVEVSVTSGGVFAVNFWLALLAVMAWPVILLMLHGNFESRRLAPVKE